MISNLKSGKHKKQEILKDHICLSYDSDWSKKLFHRAIEPNENVHKK